jgi:hypothetical protein
MRRDPRGRWTSVQAGAEGRYRLMQAREALPFRPKPRPLRCCGRFCYWRPPLGPWRCSGECGRDHAGPMPANAEHRLTEWAQSIPTIADWTAEQRELLGLFYDGPSLAALLSEATPA